MKKDKYFRIVLLFNANKVYDRQVVEGVGEYLQASQCHWDVFIEEDFRTRLDNINHWVCDGIIADFDDPIITQHLSQSPLSVIGVGGSYHQAKDYPSVPYIATDNYQLIHQAFLHLKQKGLKHFAFYGLPAKNYPHWSNEREYAFRQLVTREKYPGIIYNGMDITQENWQHAQNRLSDWIQTLPPQTGIIAVTDARARHLLQVCDNLNINVPEEISIIGIDDEDMTRYLSRIVSSRFSSTRFRYSASTSERAQGVLRKNFKLDFTLGSFLKQLILISWLNLTQPYLATNALTYISSVIPCSGSLERASVIVYSNRLIIKRSRVQESNTRDNQSIKPSILLLWLKIINYNPYYRERNPDFYFLSNR